MPSQDQLLRLFWPTDISSVKSSGLLIGWRNSDTDIFVIDCFEGIEQSSKEVERSLENGSLFKKSQHSVATIFDLCGCSRLHVLGTLNSTQTQPFDIRCIAAFTGADGRTPKIYCPQQSGVVIQVILFEKPSPRRMQYISLKPVYLALGDDTSKSGMDLLKTPGSLEDPLDSVLIQNTKSHSVKSHPLSPKEEVLRTVIDQVNSSQEVSWLLAENLEPFLPQSNKSLGIVEHIVKHLAFVWDNSIGLLYVFMELVLPFLLKFLSMIILVQRVASEIILYIVEWRLSSSALSLRDVSATAQQCDIRLQQLCYWPAQFFKLRKRKGDWESINTAHPDYIRFYNSLWLVANDVIIGIALGSYLLENSHRVSGYIDMWVKGYTIDGLRDTISWLRYTPAGLKLNKKLAEFLGELFIWVVDYWEGCFISLLPHLSRMVIVVGYSGFAGASMPISICSDLLSILTIHIYSFYIASARIYNWQLTAILSLFHLFRGKKRNVLRNRIDSCDYELDQLLIGTIFFTLLFFLLPTVLVYYVTFASVRMVIIALKAFLETMLACLNHFPLFALMLRLKDSRRLPGGIMFHMQYQPQHKCGDLSGRLGMVSYIHMKPIPLSFADIFYQYFQLGSKIKGHYASPHVIWCFLTGRFIPPLHRKSLYSLQYSMLPAQRANVMDTWYRFTQSFKAETGH